MDLPTLADYKKICEPHNRALAYMKLNLEFFLRDVQNIDVFSVEYREKEFANAVLKSRELNIPVEDLHDLAGLRIVVGSPPEVQLIEHFFHRQETSKDLTILKKQSVDREDGYRATHILIELKPSYLRSPQPGRIEVQIVTIFQHAFNFLSRSWQYKKPWQMSSEWRANFQSASQLLHEIESKIASLYDDVVSGALNLDDAPLTPHTMQRLISTELQDAVSLDACVDYCRMFAHMACTTNGHFRSFLRNEEIRSLYVLSREQNQANTGLGMFSTLSPFTFWSMVGTRMHASNFREFLQSAVRKHDS
jgi:ppGpp synthetase/RelA/SpoT-type nucleotidyltranferase